MICKFCGDKYDAQTEYCDCSDKLRKLYSHAVVDVVLPSDDFRALVKGMFEGKTLVNTVALHAFIKSRERKAVKWVLSKVDNIREPVDYDDYEQSEEYLKDE